MDGLDDATAPEQLPVRAIHRFVGHGNRDWRSDFEEYDLTLGIRGELAENLGYDIHVQYYRHDEVETGDTFVSESLVTAAIESGRYDIVDPLSTAPGQLARLPQLGTSLG